MAMVDRFVILNNVQFEKNGYQNRYQLSNGTWVTKPVEGGTELIKYKKYVGGQNLNELNMKWINTIKDTLEIDTEICYPKWGSECLATERLIKEVQLHGGTIYVTNPDAKDKYLNENQMRESGIEIEYCSVPKHLRIHTFEAFEKWGIDGTIKQLESAKCRMPLEVIK